MAVASKDVKDVNIDESRSELRLDVRLLGKAVTLMLRAVSVMESDDLVASS